MAPNIAMPMMTEATTVTVTARWRKMRSGMRASSFIFASARTKAMRPRMPMAKQAIDLPEPQPHVRPCSATVSSGTRPTVSATAPQ